MLLKEATSRESDRTSGVATKVVANTTDKVHQENVQRFVFCPADYTPLVRKISQDIGLDITINPKRIKIKGLEAIYYYRSIELSEQERELLLTCVLSGTPVYSFVSYLEETVRYTPTELLDEDVIVQCAEKHVRYPKWKRILDILLSSSAFFALLPLILFLAFLIKLESRGPAFFKQKRVGWRGQEFTLFKLRTMTVDAEASGPQWARENDPRVTRIGKFLRRTRLDELPQLWNVLKGDMSLVGPRPERLVFVQKLKKEIPFYEMRHMVKPGITGYAQVNYPYGSSLEDAIWKHKYDMFYIRKFSLWLDIKIILKTVLIVLGAKGR